MNEDHIEDISAIITSGLTLAAGLGYNLPPETATIIGSCAPVVQRTISRFLSFFNGKSYSKIECARFDICYSSIVDCIRDNEVNGQKKRNDSFFEQGGMYGKIDEIAEALLRAATDDSQAIKSFHYGRLLGNALYQNKYDESSLYQLLSIAKKLSYDELCLLAVLSKMPERNFEPLLKEDDKRAGLMVSMLNLKGLGLIKRVPPYMVGTTLDHLQISVMGKDLYELMDLNKLNQRDVDNMRSMLNNYLIE